MPNRSSAAAHPATGESRLELVAEADFPTRWGQFRLLGFQLGAETALALRPVARRPSASRPVAGTLAAAGRRAPLVRIHSQCLTGDVFGSLRCDCRQQLEIALRRIAAAGDGLLIYEDKEGRGIGLMNKLRAYGLQDQGLDTVEANERLGFAADARDYALPVAILRRLGFDRVRLLSNNPEKIAALARGGVAVTARVACAPPPASARARAYLRVKRDKMGHLLAPGRGGGAARKKKGATRWRRSPSTS